MATMLAPHDPPPPPPAPDAPAPPEFEALAARADAAVRAVEALDPAARAAALALRDASEALHRAALVPIVRTLRNDPRGLELLMALVEDPAVRLVFGLHGIVRRQEPERRAPPTEAAAPPGPPATPPPAGGQGSAVRTPRSAVDLVPLRSRRTLAAALAREGWTRGPDVIDVPADRPVCVRAEHPVTADSPGAIGAIVVRSPGGLRAFRNACAHLGRPLDRACVDPDGTVSCPWHGFRFDADTGECLTMPHAQLEPLPLRVEDGVAWVRLDA